MISIIIPVYNVSEEYLLDCFESIKNQTHKDIEVVIVDDGSKKITADFIDTYSKGLDNWRVIHQKNSGVNIARKIGFKESKGEFVTFVDSDDVLADTFCERLYETASRTKADATIAERYDFSKALPKNLTTQDRRPDDVLTDKKEIVRATYVAPFGMNIYSVTIWGQLYKRQLIEKIDWEFSNYTIAEDEFWVVQTKVFADKIAYVHEQLYFYRVDPMSRSKSVKTLFFRDNNGSHEIPFISLGLEIFSKSKRLYESHHMKLPEELFAYTINCTKAFVYRVFSAGELDSSNISLAKHVAGEFLSITKSNKNNKELLLELELIKYNPEVFAQYMKMGEGYREEIVNLQEAVSSCNTELELLRKPSLKVATRKLLGSLRRSLGNR